LESRLKQSSSLRSGSSSVSTSSGVGGSSPPSSISGSSTVSNHSTVTLGPTATPGPPASVASSTGSGDTDVIMMRPKSNLSASSNLSRPPLLPIPSPIPEEDESYRSRQSTPTPASPAPVISSPIPYHPPSRPVPTVLQTGPTSPNHSRGPSKSSLSRPVTSPSEAHARPTPPPITLKGSLRGSIDGLPSPEPLLISSPPPRSPHSPHSPHSPSSPTHPGTLAGRAAEIVSSARGFLGAIWNA